MIKIKRPATAPAIFKSVVIKKFKKDLENYFKSYSQHKQQKAPWAANATVVKVLEALLKVFPKKCAYCESPLDNRETTFDHFRPSKSARGLKKEYSEVHYWWLSFHWQNLLLACASCNRAKSSWFPVKGRRAAIKATIVQVRKEDALLVDPAFDDPRLHLRFEREGKIIGNTEKGSTTVDILQLNRIDLFKKRQDSIRENEILLERILKTDLSNVKQVFTHAFDFLIDLFDSNTIKLPYLAYQRSYFYELVNEPPYFEMLLSKKKFSGNEILKRKQAQLQHFLYKYKIARFKIPLANNKIVTVEKRIQIETVRIRNFKGIHQLYFEMPAASKEKKSKIAGESWMVLLGENGVGKSSVLQAICLGLCGQTYIDRMKLKPSDLIRIPSLKEKITPVSADIELTFKGEHQDIIVHITEQKIHSNIRQPAGYVLGYGSFRITNSRKLRPEITHSIIRCQNLFFQDTSLIDYNSWLCSLDETHFNRVALALKDLMILGKNDLIVRDKKQKKVQVNKDNKKIPIDLLSDGYRSVFAMTCDIMEKLVKEETHLDVAEGVVLIDELGTHLHPRWRMMVVSRLRTVFPKIQFFTTTHDPLCLKSTRKGEIQVMKVDPFSGETILIKDLPDPAAMRADQLLASEFFGLSSTIDPDIEEKFNTYYFLLAKEDKMELTTNEKKKLGQLQKELQDDYSIAIGESERESLLLEAIDKAIVKTSFTEEAEKRLSLKHETIEQLVDLLNGRK